MLHFFPHGDGEEFFEYFDTDGSGLMDLDEFCVMIVRSEIGQGLRKEMVNMYAVRFFCWCVFTVSTVLQICDIQIIQIGGPKEMPKSPECCIIQLNGTLVGSCNMAMWLLFPFSLPSRKLTYPSSGKGTSSSKARGEGTC